MRNKQRGENRLGEYIDELRGKRTYEMLASRIEQLTGRKINQASLWRLGRGETQMPRADVFIGLALALGTTLEDLAEAAGFEFSSRWPPSVTRRMDRLSDYAPWVQEMLLSQLDTGMDVLDQQFGSEPQMRLCQIAAQLGPEDTLLIQRLEELTLARGSPPSKGDANNAQPTLKDPSPVPVSGKVRTEGSL